MKPIAPEDRALCTIFFEKETDEDGGCIAPKLLPPVSISQ